MDESTPLRIAIVGDRDAAFPPHPATDTALEHASLATGLPLDAQWIATDAFAAMDAQTAHRALGDAVIVAPGSPYRSMDGALRAVRIAREGGLPLLGTCGGFQHVVLEFARHVLGLRDAAHAEYDPYASRLFIVPLSCSLAGRAMPVTVLPETISARAYGRQTVVEQYYCNFGLDPRYALDLDRAGLRTAALDGDGEVRILELAGHPFFVATLFVPQLTSSMADPHPLLVSFLTAARMAKR